MIRLGVLCILSAFVWSNLCFAGDQTQKATTGDVCDIRPDLCGDSPAKAKKKKSKKLAKKKCRDRNDDREEMAHFPVCGQVSEISDDIEDEIEMGEARAEKAATANMPAALKRAKPSRKSDEMDFAHEVPSSDEKAASSKIRPMNYNDYLHKNANHPSLANRRSRFDQTAFTETKRVYISPAGATTGRGAPAPGSAAAAGIQPPPSTSGSAVPGANPATGTVNGIPAASGIGAAPGIAPAAGIAPVNSGSAGGDPNQTNNYGSDGNQPPPGSSGGN